MDSDAPKSLRLAFTPLVIHDLDVRPQGLVRFRMYESPLELFNRKAREREQTLTCLFSIPSI